MDFNKAVLLAESRYYNKTLHPRFWTGNKFNQDIRKKLLKIVDDVFGEPENAAEIDDIQLTGSLANYNYTKHSDLDVHILLDFSKINDDVNLVKRALDGKRFIWNLRHNIVMYDHEVEIYYQDTNEPHVASGLYSIKNDEWITEPSYNPPSLDEKDVLKKAEGISSIINRLQSEVNKDISPSEAKKWHTHGKKIKDKLQKMRSAGLKREGEFSVENLAFKELRNNGSIGKLIDLISDAYAKIYTENKTVNEISSFLDLMKSKDNTSISKTPELKEKPSSYKQSAHRGITRKRQTWVPDTHRITNDDIVNQKVEKSKEDNFSRMLTDQEVLRAANKYGVDLKTLKNGKVKELGTSKIKMWFDGANYFIQGTK